MNNLTHILFSIGILHLSLDRIQNWKERKEIDKLEYAVQHGLYDIREKAIKALGELQSKSSLPLLIDALDDKVKNVSFAAMQAIGLVGATTEIKQKIRVKTEYWTIKEHEERDNAEKLKEKKRNSTSVKWERSSKKTLDNLKQMLRKPMNTGKWL